MSNYSTDYSTDQESALEGSKLMDALMQDEYVLPLCMKQI